MYNDIRLSCVSRGNTSKRHDVALLPRQWEILPCIVHIHQFAAGSMSQCQGQREGQRKRKRKRDLASQLLRSLLLRFECEGPEARDVPSLLSQQQRVLSTSSPTSDHSSKVRKFVWRVPAKLGCHVACVLRRKRSNERWRSRPKLDESVWEHPRFTLIWLKPADRIIYVLKPLRTQISSTIGILQVSRHSRNKESSVKGRKGQGGGWSKSSWGIMLEMQGLNSLGSVVVWCSSVGSVDGWRSMLMVGWYLCSWL